MDNNRGSVKTTKKIKKGCSPKRKNATCVVYINSEKIIGVEMKVFQNVRLLTDKYNEEGIKKGDIGVILEKYNEENFEVEFSDNNGITIALFSFFKNELEPVE